MRYLLISDIHANLPAFEAVLANAKSLYDKVWCLGDLVSVGAYPNECVELLLTLNHLCVAGNDDWIVLGKGDFDKSYLDDLGQHNPEMRSGFLRTREQLTDKVRIYLDELPTLLVEGDFTLVHGSPRHPLWESLHTPRAVQANFKHLKTKYCCVGHYHAPLVFHEANEPDATCHMSAPNPDSNKSGEIIELSTQRLIINSGAVGGGVAHHLNFVYSFYGLLDTQTNTFEFRHIPLKTNPFLELRRKIYSGKPVISSETENLASIEEVKLPTTHQDKVEYRQIPSPQPPETVLEEFIIKLKSPVETIEILIPSLSKITKQSNGKATFAELYSHLLFVNRNITSVIDYLNLRVKENASEAENSAEAILAEFTHVLRELAMPLMGFIAICQELELSEDKLKDNISGIERFGKHFTQGFRYFEANWRIWLKTKGFKIDRRF